MAYSRPLDDNVAVGIESTSGYPATLTLDSPAKSFLVNTCEISQDESVADRQHPGVGGPLPVVQGAGPASVSIEAAGRGVTATVDSGTDTDWDNRGLDCLLRASGHAVAKAAGTRTYTPTTTVETFTVEQERGNFLHRAFGVAGNLTLSAELGGYLMFRFSGSGVYGPPVENSITDGGGGFTEDYVAPPRAHELTLAVGSETGLIVSAAEFDVGTSAVIRNSLGPLELPVENLGFDAAGAGTPGDDTADANDTDASDVAFFPATGEAQNDALYIGSRWPLVGAKFNVGTAGVVGTDPELAFEYNNGSYTAIPTTVNDYSGAGNAFEATGIGRILWGQLPDEEQVSVTFGGTAYTRYWYRVRINASSPNYTTAPLLTQVWAMVPGFGVKACAPARPNPRLNLTVESEASSTFDPREDYDRGTGRSVITTWGLTNNSAYQLTFTSARLANRPVLTEDGDRIVWQLSYLPDFSQGTPYSLVLT